MRDTFFADGSATVDAIPDDVMLNVQGLIGLGPSSLSNVRHLVNSSAGNPPLDRIFRQNMTTPNYLTTLLSRETDILPGGTAPVVGQLSIGSVINSYEDIEKQPKLPALRDQFGIQHWQTLMDENGIIGPDGEKITTKTTIEDPTAGTENQYHVVFDTGFTFPQV
jgi:hypothetical protein